MFVGDSYTGKSSALLKYTDDQFTESYIATIGTDFRFVQVQLAINTIKLHVWDTAVRRGLDKFRRVTTEI